MSNGKRGWEGRRKFDAKLRKVGNSYVVTIPSESIERFELEEGDFLAVDIDSKEIKYANKKRNRKREKKRK